MSRSVVPQLLLIPALFCATWMTGSVLAQEPRHAPPPPGHPLPGELPPRGFPPPPPPPPPPLPPPTAQTSGATVSPIPATPAANDSELEAARATVDSARRNTDGDELPAALMHLAALLEDRSRTREALPLLQEAVGLADGAQDERQAQHAATLVSAAYGRLGDPAQAVFWRQRADAYRDRFTRRLLRSDSAITPTAPASSGSGAAVAPASDEAPATVPDTTRANESASIWPWLVALLCGLLLLAWWRTRQRAATLEQEAAQLQRRQQHAYTLNARLQAESDQLRKQAVQDALTGALTRQAFAASLKDLLLHASHYGRPVALLVMDLDHFKSINDQFGHLSGDAALKLVVGITREHLGSGDLLGRFGGDEFLVATIDHDVPMAMALGEGIRKSVAQRAGTTHALAQLRVSIGIAHATPASGYDLELLFQRADAALYAAKRSGRDRVSLEADGGFAPQDQPALRQLSASTEGESMAGTATH